MDFSEPHYSNKQKISILYIDDEPALVEIGKLFLERGGNIAVTTATSAEEGLSLLAGGAIDGVVSDLQMPGMDGIELLREVRRRYGPLPFIIFTGKGREEAVIEALNAGVDYYLQKGGAPKPQFAELENSIIQAVEKRRIAQQLRTLSRQRERLFAGGIDITKKQRELSSIPWLSRVLFRVRHLLPTDRLLEQAN